MDANFDNAVAAGLDVAINAFGTPFTYNSHTYTGIQTDNDFTLDLVAGGFKSDYRFSLHCRKADFTTLPQPGETLTLGGTLFRFVHVITSADDPGLRFDCTCTDS